MKKNLLLALFLTTIFNLSAQEWNKLGVGIDPWNGPTVYSLKTIDSLLYIGGGIFVVGESIMKGLAVWNGTTLDTLVTNKGTRWGGPRSIEEFNNKIIVGGSFSRIAKTQLDNGLPNTRGIAAWDGTQWSSVGSGLQGGTVHVLKKHKNDLYIGGGFNSAGGLSGLNCMARWDGTNWHNVGSGVLGDFRQVRAMAIFNDDLILAGYFIKAGGKPAYNIAGWDGTQYFDLDTGVLGDVYALTVDSINNLLYVGGSVYHAGGYSGFYTTGGIIKWDGYQWEDIGINPQLNKGAYSLTIYKNQLFVGTTGSTGNLYDTILTRFDGHEWHRVEGPYSTIFAMEVYNNELIVGGIGFITTSGDTASGVARYYAPPDTVSCLFIQPYIRAMPYGTKDVGDTIKITPPYHIQFYTNNKYASSWAWDFGDGNTANIREPAHTYAASGTYNVTLEVIHPHNLSSQVCTLNVSKTITIEDVTSVGENKPAATEYLWQNIPNPFGNTTIIPYYVPQGSKGTLQIHTPQGTLINEYPLQQGHNKLEISLANYKAGMYLYSIVIDGVVKASKRMVRE